MSKSLLAGLLSIYSSPSLSLAEPHEVPVGPLQKLVQVPLDGLVLQVCHLQTEGELDPTACVTDGH